MENEIALNYQEVEKQILKILREKTPDEMKYHNINHTLDVVKATERLSASEGVSDSRNYWLLKTAALGHDLGMIYDPKNHEKRGAEVLEKLLPLYGYSKEDTETVMKMILATKLPANPQNDLERIICDADVDNFGRDDFFEKGVSLRKELELKGISMTDEKWYSGVLKLLQSHEFYTQSSKELRDKKKQQNIEEVKRRLALY